MDIDLRIMADVNDADIQYSEACAFCADSGIDVLEIFVCGIYFLVFFTWADYQTCVWFCLYENFDVIKYHLAE